MFHPTHHDLQTNGVAIPLVVVIRSAVVFWLDRLIRGHDQHTRARPQRYHLELVLRRLQLVCQARECTGTDELPHVGGVGHLDLS